jgi:hypothetical protein
MPHPCRDLQAKAAEQFALINGWKRAHRSFALGQLARCSRARKRYEFSELTDALDHPLWFRVSRDPVAMVGQPYHPDGERVRANIGHIVARHNLVVHTAPATYASIWYPGAAGFIVFTRPGTMVRWLPDQEDAFSLLAIHESEWLK